jgi:hypothetical protein
MSVTGGVVRKLEPAVAVGLRFRDAASRRFETHGGIRGRAAQGIDDPAARTELREGASVTRSVRIRRGTAAHLNRKDGKNLRI